ncbi:MAG TPA: hypothetical protein VIM11_10510 [Tepidisphaeraceae bacterium]|jgi:hypothetical protein
MEPQRKTTAELDYGLPPPVHHRQGVQRWLVRGAVAVVVVVVLVNIRPVFERIGLMYWQGKCLKYVVPTDQPVGNAGQPRCYARYVAAFGAGQTGDVVFLHEMGDSQRVLVCVSVDPAATRKSGHPCLSWDTFHTVSLLDGARTSASSQFSAYTGLPLDARFYGGQLDPEDPKHLTIEYEANGHKGTIDGWLFVDNLRLQLREAPRLFR